MFLPHAVREIIFVSPFFYVMIYNIAIYSLKFEFHYRHT